MIPHFGLEDYVPYALYFGGVVAFLVSFRRPIVGLYALALMLPLQTIRSRLFDFPLGNKFIDILLLGIVIGVFLRDGFAGFKTPLASLFVLLTVFYYLSLVQGSLYLGAPLPFSLSDVRFSNWKNYVEMFLYCVLTVGVIRDKKQALWLLVVIAVSVLLVNKGFHDTMGGRDLSHFSHEARFAGTLGYAGENGLASFEIMVAAFFVGIYGFARKWLLKLGLLALILTCCYCILYSFSREAYVAFLAGLILIGLLKERKLLIVVAIVLFAWETVLPQSVQERIAMTSEDTGVGEQLDPSAVARLEIWKDALNVFSSSPILGVGFDTYEFLSRVESYSDTHNYYVKVLFETGLIGMLLFLWLLGRMWVLSYQLFREARDPFWSSIGLGFLGLICAATVVNFFGDRWTYQQLDGYLWILLGCVIRGLIIARTKESEVDEGDMAEPLFAPAGLPSGVLTA